MRNSTWILCAVIMVGWIGCAYNPALPSDPFLCGEGGKCPDGYTCYGGTCMDHVPACLDPANNVEYLGWPDDSDLEPNNHPDLAVVLPCGDDAIAINPAEYMQRCPNRQEYTNGFMNLVTCPNGDRDFYAIYMMPNETVAFQILYQYDSTLPRDLDAKVWTWDWTKSPPNGDWNSEVAIGASTNDNETLTVSTASGSGNLQGWYYLEVYGKTYADLNFYTVSFTLNATNI